MSAAAPRSRRSEVSVFGEVGLGHADDELARLLRGRAVELELARAVRHVVERELVRRVDDALSRLARGVDRREPRR